MSDNTSHPVVCFGEILWDILPSGTVPGGAPMNVAYHLNKQNKNPALITKIGIDESGKELINVLSGQNVCTDFFQIDYEYETGKVYANPNQFNEVIYDIVIPSAWDFIVWENEFEELISKSKYFVFGSLAARSQTSKETLFRLLELARNKVLDINLRAPHFNRRIVEQLLQKADFLKLNLAELELITGWFSQHTSIEDRIKSIRDRFKISNIVVTMGGDGALLAMDQDIIKQKGKTVSVEDTVGSGDAFLAGMLSKLIENVSPAKALEFASELGAFVATKKGACPDYDTAEINDFMKKDDIKV